MNVFKIDIANIGESIHLAKAQTDVRNTSFIPVRSKTLVNFFCSLLESSGNKKKSGWISSSFVERLTVERAGDQV